MEKQMLDSLKRYLVKRFMVIPIILFINSIVTLVVALILKFRLDPELFKVLAMLAGLVGFFSLLSSLSGIVSRYAIYKQIKILRKSNELSTVLFSFQSAQPMYNDNIRLSNEFIFGKGLSFIVPYHDIERIYIYEHSTEFIKDQRYLKAKLIYGQHIELCTLKLYKNTKEDETAVINAILKRSPNIKVGYQP